MERLILHHRRSGEDFLADVGEILADGEYPIYSISAALDFYQARLVRSGRLDPTCVWAEPVEEAKTTAEYRITHPIKYSHASLAMDSDLTARNMTEGE